MKDSVSEGHIKDGKLILNGGFRLVIALISSGVIAMNAYAYYVVFPKTVDNIVLNDRESRARDTRLDDKIESVKELTFDNKVLVQRIIGIEKDLDEIKGLLKRSARQR